MCKILYRWIFLRKEQKWHTNSTFQNLKSLVSSIKSIKTKYFIEFSVQKSVPHHPKNKKVTVFVDSIGETNDFKFWNVELGCHFCSFLRKSHLYKLSFFIEQGMVLWFFSGFLHAPIKQHELPFCPFVIFVLEFLNGRRS